MLPQGAVTPQQSREWFRDMARNVKSMSVPAFQKNTTPFQNVENLSENSVGRMYFFQYDPKTKNEMDYYDTFPLVFPIELPFPGSEPGFLVINLHYISPVLRARLMDALYTTINNNKLNKTTKLQINYGILKSASQFKYFKPCVKHYLFSHVQSSFINQNPAVWDYALLLPAERFKKKSKEYVWMNSLLKMA